MKLCEMKNQINQIEIFLDDKILSYKVKDNNGESYNKMWVLDDNLKRGITSLVKVGSENINKSFDVLPYVKAFSINELGDFAKTFGVSSKGTKDLEEILSVIESVVQNAGEKNELTKVLFEKYAPEFLETKNKISSGCHEAISEIVNFNTQEEKVLSPELSILPDKTFEVAMVDGNKERIETREIVHLEKVDKISDMEEASKLLKLVDVYSKSPKEVKNEIISNIRYNLSSEFKMSEINERKPFLDSHNDFSKSIAKVKFEVMIQKLQDNFEKYKEELTKKVEELVERNEKLESNNSEENEYAIDLEARLSSDNYETGLDSNE